MTTAKEVFSKALELLEDEEITIPFTAENKLNSFRVSLYHEKDKNPVNNIVITKQGLTLVIQKGSREPKEDVTFSISKKPETVPFIQHPNSKQKPGAIEIQKLEDRKKLLLEFQCKNIKELGWEKYQEETNVLGSELDNTEKEIRYIEKMIPEMRKLFGVPLQRIPATISELIEFNQSLPEDARDEIELNAVKNIINEED